MILDVLGWALVTFILWNVGGVAYICWKFKKDLFN